MSKLEKLCRLAGVGGALAALIMLPVLLAGTPAHAAAPIDAFYVNYFANAQLGTPSQDDIVRIIDTNVGNLTPPLCAMIYIFDEYQELQECCGCPLSAGARIDLSVDGLTDNPVSDFVQTGVPGAPSELYRGTIKIVSTTSDIIDTAGLNPAIYGPCAGALAVACDPTGFLYTPVPTQSLRAWTTHLENYEVDFGYVTETRFERTDEPNTDFLSLEEQCFNRRETGSGRGSCAAVCAAQGLNPYTHTDNFLCTGPGAPYPCCTNQYTGHCEVPAYFTEGEPPLLCYTGY